MVTLISNITIGNFQFSGVNEVRIKRSIHSYVQTATIKLPSVSQVSKKGQVIASLVTTGSLFNNGDPVSINLGYDSETGLEMHNEFKGFIKTCDPGMPLVINCEGYSRQLRLNNNISQYFKKTSVRQLLEFATRGTDIHVEVPDDIPLYGIRLPGISGASICDYIIKACEGAVTIFFKTPTLLWAGLVYTGYAQGIDPFGIGNVKYRLGYNVVKDNQLKERGLADEPLQVIFGNKLPTGETIFTSSQLKAAKAKLNALLVHIPSKEWLQNLADEKQYRVNYEGYEGKINAFLQPFAEPGYSAYVKDVLYPDRIGTYLIESTDVIFGINGARRNVELGPQINFNG